MSYRASMIIGTAVMTIALAGCDDDPTGPPTSDPVNWSAEISPEGDFQLTGAAALESEAGAFTVLIDIENGNEEDEHFWYIGEGATCGDPADRIGETDDYPALEPNVDGEASAEATVGEELSTGSEYHVAVLSAGEEEEDPPIFVACGTLEAEDEDS